MRLLSRDPAAPAACGCKCRPHRYVGRYARTWDSHCTTDINLRPALLATHKIAMSPARKGILGCAVSGQTLRGNCFAQPRATPDLPHKHPAFTGSSRTLLDATESINPLYTRSAGQDWTTLEANESHWWAGWESIENTQARRTWVARCGHARLPPNLPPQSGGTEQNWNPMKI